MSFPVMNLRLVLMSSNIRQMYIQLNFQVSTCFSLWKITFFLI